MNILIIGGLLVLAVVAIVGAVLLGIGEERAEKQRKEKSAALPVQTSPAPQMLGTTPPTTTLPPTLYETLTSEDRRTTRQLAPSLHEDEHFPTRRSGQLSVPNDEYFSTRRSGQLSVPNDEYFSARRSGQLSVPNDEHFSIRRSGQLSVPNDEDSIMLVNGQIHSIASELRALAQHAGELEQRLSALSEVLESQQHSQNGATAKHSAFRKIEISSF